MFQTPESEPQDLLLIQELVATYLPAKQSEAKDSASDVASSDEEVTPEVPVQFAVQVEPVKEKSPEIERILVPESDSESESDSDSAPDDSVPEKLQEDFDDIDEGIAVAAAVQSYLPTVNEVVDADAHVPDMEEVEPDEILEKVGEIMSVIDKMVIVKGTPSGGAAPNRIRALDTDTLLVFEDRKVLGYIYETFGPTAQPMYQVKFNSSTQIDSKKVALSRDVFHIPRCSRFVFVTDTKGSDASNVNDEEPNENELEFSDDEAEMAHRQRLKHNRRSQSVASSRFGSPSRDRDTVMEVYDPYDPEFTLTRSRPTPIAYDVDPYADNLAEAVLEAHGIDPVERSRALPVHAPTRPIRGRGPPRDRRGRTRGRSNDPRGGSNAPNRVSPARSQPPLQSPPAPPYQNHPPFHDAPRPSAYPLAAPYNPMYFPQEGWNQPAVLPHINPRFASSFGMAVYPIQPPSFQPQYPPITAPQDRSGWPENAPGQEFDRMG